MTTRKIYVLAAIVAAAFAATLTAEESSGKTQRANPCEKDIASLCSEAKSEGREAVKTCLEKNKDSLSDTCKQFISKGGKKQGKRGACMSDAKKFCSDVKKGDFKAMKSCLEKNKSDLSTDCAQELANMKEPPQKMGKDSGSNGETAEGGGNGGRPDGPPPDGDRPDGPPPDGSRQGGPQEDM